MDSLTLMHRTNLELKRIEGTLAHGTGNPLPDYGVVRPSNVIGASGLRPVGPLPAAP